MAFGSACRPYQLNYSFAKVTDPETTVLTRRKQQQHG
jgi:hypothetical protein